jgi:hypothetical protein
MSFRDIEVRPETFVCYGCGRTVERNLTEQFHAMELCGQMCFNMWAIEQITALQSRGRKE